MVGNIPTKLLKEMSNVCALPISNLWKGETKTRTKSFPKNLKLAGLAPMFQKEESSLLKSVRSVSILAAVFKNYETVRQMQVLKYLDKQLSPRLCGYKRMLYRNSSNIHDLKLEIRQK